MGLTWLRTSADAIQAAAVLIVNLVVRKVGACYDSAAESVGTTMAWFVAGADRSQKMIERTAATFVIKPE